MDDEDYCIEEWSDAEDGYESSSSDDEVQSYLKNHFGLVEVEDDFESEVDKIMTEHIRKMENSSTEEIPKLNSIEAESSKIETESSKESKTSDKDEKSNEDLFYDPDMDDDDEKWVNEKRRSYIFPSENIANADKKPKPLPNSDAVLNCPACLSLLCLDCQRHSVYRNQYRAMFVSNCKVISDETLSYPIKKKKKKESQPLLDDVYNPVRCSVCNTEVAVYDTDEVFHFFNVLASYA